MNVVGIIGSLRKESIHRVIFNEYQKNCSSKFNLIEGDISQFPLYNQDIESEPKAVLELSESIKKSDGVIFFTPEYNYSIPGVLKNAIDWLSRNNLKPFENKKSAIIGASPGGIATARMQYHLRQVGVFLNIKFLNKPEVMIGHAYDKIKDGRIIDESTLSFLQKHIEQFDLELKS